jgi:hypothetical protein
MKYESLFEVIEHQFQQDGICTVEYCLPSGTTILNAAIFAKESLYDIIDFETIDLNYFIDAHRTIWAIRTNKRLSKRVEVDVEHLYFPEIKPSSSVPNDYYEIQTEILKQYFIEILLTAMKNHGFIN